MNLYQILDFIKSDDSIFRNITSWHKTPPRQGKYSEFPQEMPEILKKVLKEKGIHQLYTHQAKAWEHIQNNKNITVVTPTASGKSLCYHLPVLSSIIQGMDKKALYIFPTKALAQDQLNDLYQLIEKIQLPIKTYTFDGDTPASARKAVRTAGEIIITNPDMLHSGILPHHTMWVKFFESLHYVVIDELHIYRGVFGSQTCNVLRRLKRIARFYGRELQFICASATIKNPGELASKLIGEPVELITENGSPSGEKHFLLYNPPVVNKELGIRRSVVKETAKISKIFIGNHISTIIFGRSRLRVEILLTELKRLLPRLTNKIRGYRGGYLPLQRREIEKGLRDKSILAVVSTNALELGIDIGQLEIAVLAGFPGSISSLYQQSGRAGRGTESSIALMIASSAPIDQYLINNPQYLFEQTPEEGIINPDNLLILTDHLKCASFELPFEVSEIFGGIPVKDILDYLKEQDFLTYSQDKYYWSSSVYPAQSVNLRTASPENFTICDITKNNRIIGEVDYFSAPTLIHQDAVYIHESVTYQVQTLDWNQKRAFVRPVVSDYYTDAQEKVDARILTDDKITENDFYQLSYGEMNITRLAVMYKKIKFTTMENVGWGNINLPEITMPTTGTRIILKKIPEELINEENLSGALLGTANLIREIAPLYLFCDKNDIRTTAWIKSPIDEKPAIILYDSYAGGIGLADRFFLAVPEILQRARQYITQCPCPSGCPACVGPLDSAPPAGNWLSKKNSAFILIENLIKNVPN